MIMAPKLLAKMFLDRRKFKGATEFAFRPKLTSARGTDAVKLRSRRGGFSHTVMLRRGTTDAETFSHILLGNDYNLRRFPVHYSAVMDRYESSLRPLIVDAGANVGLTSVYMAANFPRALIVAIEPDQGNYELLKRNVAGLNVITMKAALACSPGWATIINPHDDAWTYRTKITENGSIPAVSMTQLLQDYPEHQPLLAKIDIEGAESDVFSSDVDWIASFPALIVELHDWMLPGQGTSGSFLSGIAGRGRDFLVYGENILSIAMGA